MATLSEKLALLSNPAPIVIDPEDDVNSETVPKIQKNSDNAEAIFTSSELRSKAAVLLDDCDPAYVGKKVSRKSLDGIFFDDSKKDSNPSESDNSDSSGEIDEDMDEEDDDGKLEQFQNLLSKQINSDEESGGDENDEESGGDENDEESGVDGRDEESGIDKSDDESDVDKIDDSGDFEDVGTSDDISKKFSNIGVTSMQEKGNCVKAQKELWNRLCESRIKLQKSLIIFNKLPQAENFNRCKLKAGENFDNTLVCDKLKHLLNKYINLQEKIVWNAPEFRNQSNMQKEKGNQSDEEIPSDTDEEMDVDHKAELQIPRAKPMKRKLNCDQYKDELSKRYKSLIPHKHSIIQKWDEKSKLSSGKITLKSFAGFESSAVEQIKQVLQDENRLIKRTQLKRSLYRVLGKPEISEDKDEESLQNAESKSKQDMLLKDYDDEIFDDDDFYRQLLKEVIESKTAGINPAVLRKQMEIQSVRNKIKRKVDTKASKGRKIRYDIHPKLVGFMRKSETTTISDDARENLLKSMFGKCCINSS